MEEKNIQYEVVDLPSKGLIYPKSSLLSEGSVKIKYPTAREEDILTNANLIKNGTVFDKLIESVLVDKINIKELTLGDKNALLLAIRILAYGKEYKIKYKETPLTVDLSKAREKMLDEKLLTSSNVNEFFFTLPNSQVEISFKIPTVSDEQNIDKEIEGIRKIRPNENPSVTTRLKHIITSVGNNRSTEIIRDFVDKMLSRDSKALREYVNKISPSVEIIHAHDFGNGEEEFEVPITMEFFWPE